jgi:hypothetical protein
MNIAGLMVLAHTQVQIAAFQPLAIKLTPLFANAWVVPTDDARPRIEGPELT